MFNKTLLMIELLVQAVACNGRGFAQLGYLMLCQTQWWC